MEAIRHVEDVVLEAGGAGWGTPARTGPRCARRAGWAVGSTLCNCWSPGEGRVLVDADAALRSFPAAIKLSLGGGSSLRPMMWMFLAILVTFLVTRTVTRLIRSGSGGGGLGNVRIAGIHVHHQVFGILILIGTGIVLVSATPHGAALDAAAAIFGVGVSLTLDEFALWLHLEDVYWAKEGRKSVDAIFCVLAVTGALIGGADLLSGRIGTAVWWSSVSALAVGLLLSVICLLKGKVTTGVIGVVIALVALVGAVRLAKPGSWWATQRYASRPKRAARAARRYGPRYQERWNRLRDLVAGAPSHEHPG
jgi:hypothetical protein